MAAGTACTACSGVCNTPRHAGHTASATAAAAAAAAAETALPAAVFCSAAMSSVGVSVEAVCKGATLLTAGCWRWAGSAEGPQGVGAAAGEAVVLRLPVLSVVVWGSGQAACLASAVTVSSAKPIGGAAATACPVCQHDVNTTPLWHWGGSED